MKRTILTFSLIIVAWPSTAQAMNFKSSVPRVARTYPDAPTIYLTQPTTERRELLVYEGVQAPFDLTKAWSDSGKNFRVFGIWNGRGDEFSSSFSRNSYIWPPRRATECVEEILDEGKTLYECTGNGDRLLGTASDEKRFQRLEEQVNKIRENLPREAAAVGT
jgi:hypothetical protein